MRALLPVCFAVVMSPVLDPLPALAQEVPTEVGQCVATTIAEITSRLEGVPDSGTAIRYGNDVWGVSYEMVDAIGNAKVGDEVELCLSSIPQGCPAGDDRGRFYAAHDKRTGEDWELPDAQHMCGGA